MPTISLTTDFGEEDFYTAILKARILSRVPTANFIDVSHKIQAFDITEAAYVLGNVFDKFPTGTIHLAVVNWFMDQDDSFITFKRKDHYFIGPNNGLFSLMFPGLKKVNVFKIPYNAGSEMAMQVAFANCIENILNDPEMNQFVPMDIDFQERISVQPIISESHIRGTVIHIDHFENIIINVRKDQFERVCKGREFFLFYDPRHPIKVISNSYSDVGIGDVLCMFNSAGYLELAVNMGKAGSMLGLKKEDTIQIDFREYYD